MIVRPTMHWLRMLFIWRGSVLRSVLPQLILVFCVSSAITWSGGIFFGYQVPLTSAPFALLGVSLAIFLGFRNSSSYDRYWEGRKLWGSLLNISRSLVRQGLSLAGLPPDDPRMQEFVSLLAAFAHTLRHQLRNSNPQADLERLLPPASQDVILKARFKPAMILTLAGNWVSERMREGCYGEITAAAFDGNLNLLSDVLGGCERLSNTPLPYSYSVMIHRTVYLYCFFLPFALVRDTGIMTPALSVLIAYSFMALEALAQEIEEPFGFSDNDLALEAMSDTIENSMREMIGEPIPDARPMPDNWVLQ